ncbi:MAG: hypothetical protein A2271_05105 [Candidatus Moranbacteria bacterium RIFOXYA12_FULL_35_19]|nr:MAG: hypothetical protein UR78_C0018G0013 [Candidatus Moranbacteria bacterium GW2011_GWF2_35_39]OGI31008.1 MAG: hypothetical protein A2343_01975 [Candidatus Moranbacteria bacterium RIFOXYB12_FULL_35_8]OGI32118.1 MAG: hypothetical protein A2489_02065 [Candidatus Moranbacteria bacterium RIFOXYC12_FULL_36_13]OGI35086.1 MAG: hypothetical protein A2271_05105 [Candidatus Moranbacteria bacterium RIFOXYA12_FULL_35_19]
MWYEIFFIVSFNIYQIIDAIATFVGFINVNIFGIVGLCIIFYFIFAIFHNKSIRHSYKRENGDNIKKYIVQRCYEDGFGHDKDGKIVASEKVEKKDKYGNKEIIDINNEEENRGYFYLLDKNLKVYYRIIDTYTLTQLGYPRPSRRVDKCFRLSDGYGIGEEIKIYNIISEIKEIWKGK